MWKLVVLPAPFGPSRPTTSPARTSMLTLLHHAAPAERLGEAVGAEERRAGAVHRASALAAAAARRAVGFAGPLGRCRASRSG